VYRLVLSSVLMSVLLSPLASGDEVSLRDPTKPLSYATKVPGSEALILQAVYLSSHRREAIVNGKVLKVGDWVGGAQVEKIESKKIVVRRNGQQRTLSLRPSIINTPRSR